MTPEQFAQSLEVEWAARIFIDSVSYSSPLPLWNEVKIFKYDDVAERIEKKIIEYVKETKQVTKPYQILVSYKKNDPRLWLFPSLTEQVILHACSAALGKTIKLDSKRVFTYQHRPNEIHFLSSHLNQWVNFQTETANRLKKYKYVLHLDIKKAINNVHRPDFFNYLREQTDNEMVVNLLQKMLDTWMGKHAGLPLINDSLFYLLNAYFQVLDKTIIRYTDNYIRFVDDFRIFGQSKSELEKQYEKINEGINKLGFSINDKKVKLISRDNYVRAINKVENIDDYNEEEYFGPLLFRNIVEPSQLVEIISTILNDPDKYLTVRLGRLVLREIRKLRANEDNGSVAIDIYRHTMINNNALRNRLRSLIKSYANQQPDKQWHLVWLLYVSHDIIETQDSSDEQKLLEKLTKKLDKNSITFLWTKKILYGRHKPRPINGDDLAYMDANYVDEGKLLYGEP